MSRGKRRISAVFFLLLIVLILHMTAWGGEISQGELPGIEDLGLEKIQEFLDERGELGGLSFSGLMEELAQGNWQQAAERLFQGLRYELFTKNGDSIRFLSQAAALGILGAVFSQAAAVFPSSKVSETGFFITYLLTFTCLTASFFTSVETAEAVVNHSLEFMRVLLPSFFLAVALAGGSISGAALYSSVIAGVSAADFLCGKVLLPLIKVYVLLILAGNLSREPLISRMTSFLESGIKWTL